MWENTIYKHLTAFFDYASQLETTLSPMPQTIALLHCGL